MLTKFLSKLLLTSLISTSVLASAQSNHTSNNTLDAQSSDPEKLEWMTGSPPSPEKLIMHPQSDYFSFPKLRWTVCHIRELLPTKQVSRGLGSAIPFSSNIDSNIDTI